MSGQFRILSTIELYRVVELILAKGGMKDGNGEKERRFFQAVTLILLTWRIW
jgi:hypothetical protein